MKRQFAAMSALAAVALLLCSPSHSVELIIKSRAVEPGTSGSLPIYARNVAGDRPGVDNALWGFDFALFLSGGDVTLSGSLPFTPYIAPVPEKDVLVQATSGFVSQGTPKGAPALYVCYAKLFGFPLVQALGKLNVDVDASAEKKGFSKLDVSENNTYTIKPYTTRDAIVRAGASASRSTGLTLNVGATIEPITVLDYMPDDTKPPEPFPDPDPTTIQIKVPLHTVVFGRPGDINGDGILNSADVSLMRLILTGKYKPGASAYMMVAGDLAPRVGVTADRPDGSDGKGYGDGWLSQGDYDALKKLTLGVPLMTGSPNLP